jgi:hypothetical protein
MFSHYIFFPLYLKFILISMKNYLSANLLVIIFFLSLFSVPFHAKRIYVSPLGNDSQSGSISKPVRSIERAIEKASISDTIILRDGNYQIEKTLCIPSGKDHIFLAAEHSGKVSISMNIEIGTKNFSPVTDPMVYRRLRTDVAGQVKELDLNRYKIRVAGFKPIFNTLEQFPEIYLGKQRLPLSRYPNEGYMKMKRVLDNFGNDSHGGVFEYSDSRHEAWLQAVKEGLWMTGFWRIPWQDNTVQIKDINVKDKTVTQAVGIGLASNPSKNGAGNGIGSKYKRPYGSGEEPYYVINIPEEIDQPGEWCIDFKRQKLYILLPQNNPAQPIKICCNYIPLLKLEHVNGVHISGIVFELSGENGIEIYGGNNDCVQGCTFRYLSGTGIILDGGVNHQIKSNDFYAIGKEGISAMGGDRKTLTPCHFLIENNYFHNYGTVKKSWVAAVRLGRYEASGGDKAGEDAVGITIRHNLVHDAPHAAFLYVGNQNIFEYNEVFDIAKNTGDVGAFYSRHDWTSRGNVIRYNFIHHIPRANGTYHDDGHSGDSVYNNIIHRALTGTLIGGGHENVVQNNIYIDCIHQAISIDSRGKHRNYTLQNPDYTFRFKLYHLDSGNWKKYYPEMMHWLEQEHLELPHQDVIENNYFINCPKGLTLSGDKEDFIYSPRLSGGKPIQADKNLILQLMEKKDNSRLKELGINGSFPIGSIGLYRDSFRKTLPDTRKLVEGTSNEAGFNSSKDIQTSNKL